MVTLIPTHKEHEVSFPLLKGETDIGINYYEVKAIFTTKI